MRAMPTCPIRSLYVSCIDGCAKKYIAKSRGFNMKSAENITNNFWKTGNFDDFTWEKCAFGRKTAMLEKKLAIAHRIRL